MSESAQLTLKDVASAVGVSSMTVSLALRNHPKIPAGRRALIQDVAQRMGYRPNAMATALGYQRKNCSHHPISAALAWLNLWPDPGQLRRFKEFDLYWRGAAQAAEKCGFRLDQFIVNPPLTCSRLERILQSRNIQGILIPPHGHTAMAGPTAASFDWSRYSIVKFGYSLPDIPAHTVTSNHTQGTLLAFLEMTNKGYERVGYVCHKCSSTRSRAGFLLAQTDLPLRQRLPLLELDAHATNGVERLKLWIHANRPDAILTEMAEMPVMLAALGLRIPKDLGLAATSVLDGNVDAGIYQNSEEIGKVAVEALIALIYQNQTGLPKLCREILLDSAWRDGRSLPSRRRFDDSPVKSSVPIRG